MFELDCGGYEFMVYGSDKEVLKKIKNYYVSEGEVSEDDVFIVEWDVEGLRNEIKLMWSGDDCEFYLENINKVLNLVNEGKCVYVSVCRGEFEIEDEDFKIE